MKFQAYGQLRYFEDPYKLIVEVEPEISYYYASLVPKYFRLNRQKYAPHISVVRHEIPVKLENWRKYEGSLISFNYNNEIENDEKYFWLGAASKELEKIRVELGLVNVNWITKTPDGSHNFHITIGNIKDL